MAATLRRADQRRPLRPRKNLRVTALRDLDGMAEALEHLGDYAAGDRIEAETDLSETHHSAIRT